MEISEKMVQVIKQTHTESLTGRIDNNGICFIGRGHRLQGNYKNKERVIRITRKESEAYFVSDIKKIQKQARSLLKPMLSTVPQNHFDVFCSLLYDFPLSYVQNSSFYKEYMKGNITTASTKIIIWSKRRGVLSKALSFRRNIDINIYLNSKYIYKKARIKE